MSDRARQSAVTAVARSGKAITYVRVEEGAYDAATGAPEAIERRYSGRIVLVSAGGEAARNASSEFAAGLAAGTYQVGLLAAADWPFDPAPGDRVEIDLKEAIVRAARPTWAGEQVALWRVILER